MRNIIKLSKSAGTGIFATVVDFFALVLLVEQLRFAPYAANFVALLLGAIIQFIGNKYLVFFGGGRRPLNQEILLFIIAEILSFGLNFYGFYFLYRWWPVHYLVIRIMVGFVVFFGFSFPMWNWIFAHRKI